MWKIAGALGVVGLVVLIIPARGEEDAQVRDAVARAIKAQGGSAVLQKWQGNASKTKGKFHGLGEAIDYTGESAVQLPNRLRTEAQMKVGDQDFTFIQVVNGNKGWIKIGDQTNEMNQEMLAEAREQLNAANITHLICLKDKEYKLSPLGEVKVGDRPASGVRVERKGYRDVSLFFDKDKGLLLKMETRGKNVMQDGEEYTATTFYSDYKKVEGMMVPHKVKLERDGKPFVESEVLEAKVAEKLEDSMFEKP